MGSDGTVEVDMVEGVTDEEVMKAMNNMKLGKAAGPSEVNMDMIIACGTFGVGVMKKLCQRVLDGEGMPEEWKTSAVVPIFKGKGDVMDCGAYRGVKLLEHAMKIVERVLENGIRELVMLDEMQFGFMSGKGTTHALFIIIGGQYHKYFFGTSTVGTLEKSTGTAVAVLSFFNFYAVLGPFAKSFVIKKKSAQLHLPQQSLERFVFKIQYRHPVKRGNRTILFQQKKMF